MRHTPTAFAKRSAPIPRGSEKSIPIPRSRSEVTSFIRSRNRLRKITVFLGTTDPTSAWSKFHERIARLTAGIDKSLVGITFLGEQLFAIGEGELRRGVIQIHQEELLHWRLCRDRKASAPGTGCTLKPEEPSRSSLTSVMLLSWKSAAISATGH